MSARQPAKRDHAMPNGGRPNIGPQALILPAETVELIAQRVAAILAERLPETASPWLSVAEAAERLRCKPDRIYDLIAASKLRPQRDGRRVLLHRDDLDAYLEGST